MKRDIFLTCMVLLQVFNNVASASPLHRKALDKLATRQKEKEVRAYSHKEDDLMSPFASVSIAGAKDEVVKGGSLPVLNRVVINTSAGVLAVFNGPWAQTARDRLRGWLKNKARIETQEGMRAALFHIKETLDKVERQKDIKTTGALVAVTAARRLVWGCFPGEYLLAVQKPDDVVFLARHSGQKRDSGSVEIKEFDPFLTQGDGLILSTPDTIDMLLQVKTSTAAGKARQEVHEILGGIIQASRKTGNPALKALEEGRRLVEKVAYTSVSYPLKTTIVAATIKDRQYFNGGAFEDE